MIECNYFMYPHTKFDEPRPYSARDMAMRKNCGQQIYIDRRMDVTMTFFVSKDPLEAGQGAGERY